jgi:IrrE N-terminal-like domain
MKYLPDRSGRFPKRPHYEPSELDQECEHIITDFMCSHCGGFRLPIPTEALTKLIERDADDLDLFADLSGEGEDVEGVTDFIPQERPRVRIRSSLSDAGRENRFRTTLAHEYGHVKFHDFLWQAEVKNPRLHPQFAQAASPKCHRGRILDAPYSDWMEWQAGYVSGALLMPVRSMREITGRFLEDHKLFTPVPASAEESGKLINLISAAFAVSRDAARVRLLKLNLLSDHDLGPQLL